MFKDSKGDYRDNRGATYGPGGIPNLTFPNTKGWEWDGKWAHSEGTGLNPNDYNGLEPYYRTVHNKNAKRNENVY